MTTPRGKSILKKARISKRYENTYKKTIANDNKQKRTRENAKQTKPEKLVTEILTKHHIEFETEHEILGLFFDFYLPKYNILIETDGVYWHGRDKKDEEMKMWEIQQKVQDIYKSAVATIKQSKLIRLWEDQIEENALINMIKTDTDTIVHND